MDPWAFVRSFTIFIILSKLGVFNLDASYGMDRRKIYHFKCYYILCYYVSRYRILLHLASKVTTFCVNKFITFCLKSYLHFPLLLHFVRVITFCGVTPPTQMHQAQYNTRLFLSNQVRKSVVLMGSSLQSHL